MQIIHSDSVPRAKQLCKEVLMYLQKKEWCTLVFWLQRFPQNYHITLI